MPKMESLIAARNGSDKAEAGRDAARIVSLCGKDCRTCGRGEACAAFMVDFSHAMDQMRATS